MMRMATVLFETIQVRVALKILKGGRCSCECSSK